MSRDLLSSSGVRCRCARRIGCAASAAPQTPPCGIKSCPVGGGVRPKCRARNAALRQPAPSLSFLRSALLRCVTSAPAESAPRGPRCARLAPGATNRRTNAAFAHALRGAAGRRALSSLRSSASGSAPVASALVASSGSAWPGARGARALAPACRGVALRAVTNDPGRTARRWRAGMPPRTPRLRSSSNGFRCVAPTVPA